MPLTPQQLEDRRKGIGGSDCPVILGLCPWSKPIDVWRAKVEGVDRPATVAMLIGNAVEDAVRVAAARKLGIEIDVPDTFARGIQRANLDGLAVMDGRKVNVQIKTTRSTKRFAAGVPLDVQAQVQHEMYAADLPATIVVVANLFKVADCVIGDDMPLDIFTVERDDAAIAEIVRRENEWWSKYVVARVPPEE